MIRLDQSAYISNGLLNHKTLTRQGLNLFFKRFSYNFSN